MPALEKIAEHYLRRSDKRKDEFREDPQVMTELAKVRGAIERALEDTEFFHGTGRKHYGFEGDSQYDGIDHRVVVDRLESLAKDGLHPQTDLYAENFTGDGETKTISLSKNRMYSRVYADLHMNEHDQYQYEYGSQAFWWYYLLYLMATTVFQDKDERNAEWARKRSEWKLGWNSLLDKTKDVAVKGQMIPILAHVFNAYLFVLQYFYFRNDASWKDRTENIGGEKKRDPKHWVGRFRKDFGGVRDEDSRRRKNRLYNRFASRGRSDIDGNYGMIIGIKKGKVQKKEIKRKAVKSFETRAKNTLDRDTWSYLETPLSMVETTRKDLQKKISEAGLGDFDVPIFATEYVEMVMREKSLAELAAKDEK